MAPVSQLSFALAVLMQTGLADASAMFPDCEVGTTNVFMPSPESGNCFCGGKTPKMCQPFPEYLGLNRALCQKESGDFELGSVSGSGMICGYFCLCENATWKDEKLDNVKCCRAGTKFGLKNHTVTGPDPDSTTKALKAEDFLPMPAAAHTQTSLACLFLLALGMLVARL